MKSNALGKKAIIGKTIHKKPTTDKVIPEFKVGD